MKKNVGLIDKIIRILIAIVIAYAIYAKLIVGILAIILAVFGIILIVTSIFGFCGLYTLFGIRTCPSKSK